MARAPALVRIIPGSLRRRVKGLLRPYVNRFFEAYLGDYVNAGGGRLTLSQLEPSATHLPMGRKGAGASWGYMLPKADPAQPKWADGYSTPPQALWHGYAPTLERVMEIGDINVRKMRQILAAAGGEPRRGQKLLDFGCAAGFMTRGLREIAEDRESGGEVWGVDVSGPHIEWCMRHLSPPFRFALTSSLPSLPFPDGYFDLVFCGSVFSHLGDFCDAWLLELARILKPGGRLYLTMVTKEAMWRYINEWPQIGFSKEIQKVFTREQLESDFAAAVCGDGPGLHAVYDLDVFKTKCESAFEIVSVVPDVYTYQWALVLRRPALRRPEREGAEVVVKAAGPGGGVVGAREDAASAAP